MMKEKIDQIRELLLQLERDGTNSEVDSFEHNFDALELPTLVAQVVDYLQPKLYPYEAAIYWHMFRHSIVSDGTQRVRVSVRGLCSGVVTSSSRQGEKLSYATVQEALRGLEEKRAIRKDGDTNRDGTPYLVFLPEEIPWCLDLMKQQQSEQTFPKPVDALREVDYYNIADNRLKVFERDGFKCTYCGKQLTRFSATLDHIQPVSKGGSNGIDNLVTACLLCNSSRGNRPVMEALKTKNAERSTVPDAEER
jgi:hypothetical protein